MTATPDDVVFTRVSPKYWLKETIASLCFFVPLLAAAIALPVIVSDQPWLHLPWVAVLIWTRV